MKVGIFDAKTKEFRAEDISDDLETFYKIIDCDAIDIVTRYVNGVQFDIICDDEGLLKEKPIVTAVNISFQPMLVGTLIFAHNDGNGNLTDITDDDEALLQFTTSMMGMIWPCEYFKYEKVDEA